MFSFMRAIALVIVFLAQVGNPLIVHGLYIESLGDQETDDLENIEENKINIVKAFLNDPITNYEKIQRWDDVCYWISRYEDIYCKDEENREFLINNFLKTHFQEIDEKKIEILVHMVPRCSGAYGELLSDETAKVFWLHPKMFIRVLERTDEWKRVVDSISMLGWEYFQKGLTKLDDTGFEKELKNYMAEIIW